ncbi:MAG: tetratricopeptide repeat protein [Candidatus Krumholzibacteria bacterium]|nr:tetratricopeptide repeat protein [Candidatus Krumholzibacteria bacterium]
MESLELREEIKHDGKTYFLQTSFMVEEKEIRSTFFRNGSVFDEVRKKFDELPSSEQLRDITRETHGNSKRRFQFLLDAHDRLRSSSEPGAHLRLAQALARRNLHEEAIAEAESALSKGASDSAPYMITGTSWYMLGDYDSAYEAVKTGIGISPDYPDIHNLLGRIYLKRKMCRNAVDCFRRAIDLNLYYGEPYLNLIRAYLLNSIIKQDYEISRDIEEKFNTNIKRAVQLNPFLDSNMIESVRDLFSSQQYEEALEVLESLDSSSSSDPADDILLELYLLLVKKEDGLPENDIEDYLKRMKEIIDQNPTYADAWNSMGILYTAKCKILMDQAGEAFAKALEINGDYAKAKKNQRLMENDRQGIFILLKALLD